MIEVYDQLKRLIEQVNSNGVNRAVICTVKTGTVDVSKGSCIAEPLNGDAEIIDARFVSDVSGKTMIVPKDNSIVVVQLFSPVSGVIISYSVVDSIALNGTNYGGVVMSQSLLQKINQVEQQLNNLKTIFASWIPIAGDGGAALKALATQFSSAQITPTAIADLENTTVKHGNGN